MRTVPWLLLLLCVSTATAGVMPITSFDRDTTATRSHVTRPDSAASTVWVGLQASPYVGGSKSMEQPTSWDANGMPWLGAVVTWPWTSPHEVWLAFGFERWQYKNSTELFPFNTVSLSVKQAMVRFGIDRLIGNDRAVSAAIGAGFGAGHTVGELDPLAGSDGAFCAEFLAHAVAYAPIGRHARLGAGISAGPNFLLGENGTPFVHWELLLRLDQAFTARPTP